MRKIIAMAGKWPGMFYLKAKFYGPRCFRTIALIVYQRSALPSLRPWSLRRNTIKVLII